ncbi:hypothetical protein M9Y10_037938 [Tritrichomonas musculus]|uniref:Uncharacterized protein n=1 Tax=Tritrichomonas musculus TaxID=1915356 RepID=A0ABR2K706_9EUKA
MSEKSIPKWLTRKISTLIRSGQLILPYEKDFKPSALAIRAFNKNLDLIKIFDIRGSSISTIEGLPFLPNLHTFLAESTNISSFANFSAIKKASKVSFKKSPITDFPKYKLALLIICENKLNSIDDVIVSKALIKKSSTYPPIASELIERGWVVETPTPEDDRFEELCKEYDINNEKDNKIEIEEENEELNASTNEEDDFDLIIQEYHNRQEEMFNEAEALFNIIPERDSEAELAEEISNLFGMHGIAIDANNDEIVIEAVEELCKRATIQAKTYESLTEDEGI